MSIQVQQVTKTYGKQKALDGVSFDIPSGKIVGFLGPNGAGKSTMMKIISCFILQTSGKVTVCNFDVEKQSIEARKKIGYLPENNPLYSDMYVKEYLEFVAGLYRLKDRKRKINEMIETVGLQIEQKKKIGALSKGFRQRLGLAQALIHQPEVLILDEPTSGLDPNQLVEIRNLIKKIGKEKTVMLSTHIMQEVEAICDRVIIINKGKIVADKLAKDMHKRKGTQQLITVEFDKGIAKAALMKIEGVTDVRVIQDNTWQITTDKDIRSYVFQFAVKNGLSVLTMQQEKQRLEDVFKELTMESN